MTGAAENSTSMAGTSPAGLNRSQSIIVLLMVLPFRSSSRTSAYPQHPMHFGYSFWMFQTPEVCKFF
jgi:hypothetical protein